MVWTYTLLSVVGISLISLLGVFTLALKDKLLQKILLYLVAFSSGALLGDTFIHLLPEATTGEGFTSKVAFPLFGGILFFFVMEKILRWRHCHEVGCEDHPKHLGIMNLIGDAIHNFIDGVLIAASFLVSIPIGIATALAIIFHEIPQELGDFGVLLHSGFTKKKAIAFNFLSASFAILGSVLTLLIGNKVANFSDAMIPFAAGGFLYIALSDLIPELHKEEKIYKSATQFLFIILGIMLMYLLIFLEK